MRLECADVLYGSVARPAAEAVRWLADARAAGPACRLAATPLTDGGWAAAAGTDPGVVALTCRVPPEQWLFASCLHAWLVADLPLSQLIVARPQVRILPMIPSKPAHVGGARSLVQGERPRSESPRDCRVTAFPSAVAEHFEGAALPVGGPGGGEYHERLLHLGHTRRMRARTGTGTAQEDKGARGVVRVMGSQQSGAGSREVLDRTAGIVLAE